MALIKCPECAQTVSDTAKSCPHCGYAVERHSKARAKAEQEQQARVFWESQPRANKLGWLAVIVLVIALLVWAVSALMNVDDPECGACRGSGYYQKKTCPFCDGTGYSDYDPYD